MKNAKKYTKKSFTNLTLPDAIIMIKKRNQRITQMAKLIKEQHEHIKRLVALKDSLQ